MEKTLAFLSKTAVRRRSYIVLGFLALVVVNSLEVILPLILAAMIDQLIAGGERAELFRLASIYVGISLVQACARFSWRIGLGKAAAWISHDLRLALFSSVLRKPASHLRGKTSGEFVSLSTSDSDNVGRLFGDGVVIVVDAVFMSIYISGILLWKDTLVGAAVLFPAFLIPWLVLRADKKVSAYHAETQRTLSKLTDSAHESLAHARVLKTFNAEQAFLERFRAHSLRYVVQAQRLLTIEALYGPVLEALISVSMVLLFLVGGWSVIHGTLTLGMFVAFQRYIQQLAWPMRAVALSAITLRKARVSGGRIQSSLFDGTELPIPTYAKAQFGKGLSISVKDVSLEDPESKRAILSHVSLEVRAGEKIAIVGDVGSGKTTLLNLICDADMGYSGSIEIDGTPIKEWNLAELRRKISYVPQEPFLFQLSVAGNIMIESDSTQTDEERGDTIAACEIAAIHNEIEKLQLGYDTLLGDRGVNFSGGQRQRLCIARAIVRNPALLVLDNALAAVDSETELTILNNLRRLNCTVLFATQRMSTLHFADQIIVLLNGRIEDQGTLPELLAKSESWFRRFFDAQQFEEECGREHAHPGVLKSNE